MALNLSTKDNSTNYVCTVVQINEVFDIPNADRIKRVVMFGNSIVVGSDVKKGDIMLYFVSGTKLNEDFCKYANLLDKAELNRDKVKGYISPTKLRVKAIKLKGIVSDGILVPLEALTFAGVDWENLNVGDTFTDIGDVSICEKYFVPVRSGGGTGEKKPKQNKLKELIIDNQFRFHNDTEHFARNLHKFDLETPVVITRKIHGSSLILSNVLITKKLKWWEKWLVKAGVNIPTQEYGLIWSSGKPKSRLPKGIVSESNKWETPNQSFYTENIWEKAAKLMGDKVEKGISLYAEIVGRGIQGDDYTYGQEYGVYVYKITRTNPDGHVDRFSWAQVKKYCEKYGLNHVQEYFNGKVKELVTYTDDRDKETVLLTYLSDKYLNKSYPDCAVDEGVCIEHTIEQEVFKLKSPNFVNAESEAQERGETNLEDNEGLDDNGATVDAGQEAGSGNSFYS